MQRQVLLLFPKERQKNIEGESSCISEVVGGFSESFIVLISGISSSIKITFTANTVPVLPRFVTEVCREIKSSIYCCIVKSAIHCYLYHNCGHEPPWHSLIENYVFLKRGLPSYWREPIVCLKCTASLQCKMPVQVWCTYSNICRCWFLTIYHKSIRLMMYLTGNFFQQKISATCPSFLLHSALSCKLHLPCFYKTIIKSNNWIWTLNTERRSQIRQILSKVFSSWN